MQMIYSKMFVFPVFVCTLGKCSRKYSTLCVWSNVKQIIRKYPHPKPSESTKNDPHCQPATQTHPATPQPTPKPTPQPTHTHLATLRSPLWSNPATSRSPNLPQSPPRSPSGEQRLDGREREQRKRAKREQRRLSILENGLWKNFP